MNQEISKKEAKMFNNFLAKLAVVTASAALGLAVVKVNPTQAAQLALNFDFTVTGGSLEGRQGVGGLTYDDSDPEFIRASSPDLQTPAGPGLIFNPSFVSSYFLAFVDATGNLVAYIPNNSNIGVGVTDLRIRSLQVTEDNFSNISWFFRYLDGGALEGLALPNDGSSSLVSGSYTVTQSVPEPSAALGLGVLGLGVLLRKKVAPFQKAKATTNV